MEHCDGCSAKAVVCVVTGNGELFFCAHHARINQAVLRQYPAFADITGGMALPADTAWWDYLAAHAEPASPATV